MLHAARSNYFQQEAQCVSEFSGRVDAKMRNLAVRCQACKLSEWHH